MPGSAASHQITIPTRSEQLPQTTPHIRYEDLPKAGPGTTRPPLPKIPSAALLERIALYNQQVASNMESPTPRHSSSLASPIHLAPPYGTATVASHLVRSHPNPSLSSGQHHRQISHSQCTPYCQSLSSHSGPLPKPSPPSNHEVNSIFTHSPSSGRPNLTLPTPKPMPIKFVGHTSNVTPTRRPQASGPSPPLVISPLKVMFDNASRGIHSELSYLQASCTALINRERKEKEMLRAHYYQMKRERDAARDRLKVLRQSSPPSPTERPSTKQEANPHLEIRSILKKRPRDEFELDGTAPTSSASSSSSSSSRSSSPPSPRTPSPNPQLQHVYIPSSHNDQAELTYSNHTENAHPVLSSPPPPPISARKMVFLSTPLSAPGTVMVPRSCSSSPIPAFPARSPSGPVHPTRKACSGPSSPNSDPFSDPSPFLRPALSRVSRLNVPETELSPVDFIVEDESLPPVKRRRTLNRSKEDGSVSRESPKPRVLRASSDGESGLGEGDMELESESEGSEACSEREVAKSVAMTTCASSPMVRSPVSRTSSLSSMFHSAQPLRQMCANYVRSSSQASQRVDIGGL